MCEAVASPNPIPVNPRAPDRNVFQVPAPILRILDRQGVDHDISRFMQQVAVRAQQHRNNRDEQRRIQEAQIQAGIIPVPIFDPRRYTQVSLDRIFIQQFVVSANLPSFTIG